MVQLILTEFHKYFRSKILFIIPAAVLLTTASNFLQCVNSDSGLTVTWSLYLSEASRFANLLAPAIFAILSGFIFTREYQENTINNLFTTPCSRVKVLLAKMFTTLFLIAVTLLLTLIAVLLTGLFLMHSLPSMALAMMQWKIWSLMALAQFALMPAAIAVGILGKNIIAPSVLGLLAIMMFLAFLNHEFNIYYPWCVPMMLSDKLSLHTLDYHVSSYSTAVWTLCFAFLVPFIFSIFYYLKSDIR